MFELIFGLAWLSFSLVFFAMWNFLPGGEGGEGLLILLNLMSILFMIIGAAITWVGLKKVIANKKTDRHGELCYGLITKVKTNGTVINNEPQYDAYLKVYVESTGQFVEAHESIGGNLGQFPEGTYYAVKYYEGDINFEYPARSFEGLPENVRRAFDSQVIPMEMNLDSERFENSYYDSYNDTESEYDPGKYNYDYELTRGK